ncbi:hypothetical protein B0T09DRAFT_331406, partial [Sordaria sp. MPI-SDFR-AT-0083]
ITSNDEVVSSILAVGKLFLPFLLLFVSILYYTFLFYLDQLLHWIFLLTIDITSFPVLWMSNRLFTMR